MKCVSAVQAFINLGKMDNIKVSLQHVSGKVNRMCNFGFIVVQLKLLAEVLFFFFLLWQVHSVWLTCFPAELATGAK